jgi:hypothetical protein
VADRPDPRATRSNQEPAMTSTINVIATIQVADAEGDDVGLPAPSGGELGLVLEALAGVSPVLTVVYLVARLLIPALLIVYTTRDASAKQRIALLRDYLLATTQRRDDR